MEAFRLDCDHIDFTPRSLELSPVNFFYGKNGTGKSTLVELLKRQYEVFTPYKYSGDTIVMYPRIGS